MLTMLIMLIVPSDASMEIKSRRDLHTAPIFNVCVPPMFWRKQALKFVPGSVIPCLKCYIIPGTLYAIIEILQLSQRAPVDDNYKYSPEKNPSDSYANATRCLISINDIIGDFSLAGIYLVRH